jgi:hypothetical protein
MTVHGIINMTLITLLLGRLFILTTVRKPIAVKFWRRPVGGQPVIVKALRGAPENNA